MSSFDDRLGKRNGFGSAPVISRFAIRSAAEDHGADAVRLRGRQQLAFDRASMRASRERPPTRRECYA